MGRCSAYRANLCSYDWWGPMLDREEQEERLYKLAGRFMRLKMELPRARAKGTWEGVPTAELLILMNAEIGELLEAASRYLDTDSVEDAVALALEIADVMNFGAMMLDALDRAHDLGSVEAV